MERELQTYSNIETMKRTTSNVGCCYDKEGNKTDSIIFMADDSETGQPMLVYYDVLLKKVVTYPCDNPIVPISTKIKELFVIAGLSNFSRKDNGEFTFIDKINQIVVPDVMNQKGVYRHFKDKLYLVICTAKNLMTNKTMVFYQALYGDFKLYVRDYDMFMDRVDKKKYPESKCKYRFTEVEPDDAIPVNKQISNSVTIEQYFNDNCKNNVINFSVGVNKLADEISFYIHPTHVNGDTLDFIVKGNDLIPKYNKNEGAGVNDKKEEK